MVAVDPIGLGGSDNPQVIANEQAQAAQWLQALQEAQGGGNSEVALSEAETLAKNWGAWGMHNGVDFGNPPSSLSSQAKATLEYFANNPTLFSAIVQDAGGKSGDSMTLSALNQYISDATSDANLAQQSVPSGTPNNAGSAVASAEDLVANWHTWGLHQGIDLANPPADLPAYAKNAIQSIASNPALVAAMSNGTGTVTESDAAAFLKTAAGQASDAAKLNPGNSGWSTLANGDTDTESQLNAPIQAAADLAANWEAWGLDKGIDFSKPPSYLPQQAKDDINLINNNPALTKALEAGGSGTPGNLITLNGVKGFLSAANSDLQAATTDYSNYLKANPNADASDKELARQAALLRANQTLISAANPDSKVAVDGKITAADLNAVSGSLGSQGLTSPGPSGSWSNELAQAAGLWSNPGMFHLLDNASSDPSGSSPQGYFTGADTDAWIKNAPSTNADFAGLMTQAAIYNTVAPIDTSKLGSDVFANPQNYTPGQKAAVMVQLEDLYPKLQASYQDGTYADDISRDYPEFNPNQSKLNADLMGKIGELMQDPDVQNYLSTFAPTSLQNMLNNDKDLKSTVQASYQDFQSGKSLSDDLAQKDSKGNTVSIETGLASFIQEGNFYSQALGVNVNLPGIVQASSHYQDILSEYTNNIVSGNELNTMLSNGTDLSSALQTFGSDVANFSAVLPSNVIAQNTNTLEQNYANILSDNVLNSGDVLDLNVAFSGSTDPNNLGNLDENKLNTIIQQIQNQDPSLLTDQNGNQIKPDQLVAAFRQAWSLLQGGAKTSDALTKLKLPNLGNQTIQQYYGQGVFHAISGILAGGILVAKAAESPTNPTADASTVATASTMVGSLMEATTKYGTSQLGVDGAPPTWNGFTKDQLKAIESGGKLIGGSGSVISGVLGIIGGAGEIASGDKAGGAITLAGGIAGSIQGGASLTEGALGLATFAGVDGLADIAAAAGAVAGAAGIVAGALGLVGIIYEGIEQTIQQNRLDSAFQNNVLSVLSNYGIYGGPITLNDITNPTGGGN